MKAIMSDDLEAHRHQDSKFDLHGLFAEFTDLNDISDEEYEFIREYFGNINSTQRINSRQVAAHALATCEALICMDRKIEQFQSFLE